jgi:hypothetical protein
MQTRATDATMGDLEIDQSFVPFLWGVLVRLHLEGFAGLFIMSSTLITISQDRRNRWNSIFFVTSSHFLPAPLAVRIIKHFRK